MLTAHDLPRQGLGCMTMRDDTVGDLDRDPAAVVHAALDAGVTMVDTAHLYGNEALVGRAVAPRRDEVLLATKFGVLWGDDGDWYVRADAAFVRESCEASLQRLGVETIDLYYLHHRSDETSIEETVGAMADLVREGKVRGLGLSNVTEEDLRRAHAVHPIVAVQERWSLMHLNVESMVPTAAELGVAVVAYSPTDHGHLHTSAGPASVLADVAARHGVRQVRSHWPRCSTAPNGGGSRSSRCPVRPASDTRGSTPPPRTLRSMSTTSRSWTLRRTPHWVGHAASGDERVTCTSSSGVGRRRGGTMQYERPLPAERAARCCRFFRADGDRP